MASEWRIQVPWRIPTPLHGPPEVWDDLTCLAATILGEAEGESHIGQVCVGEVIMNRVDDLKARWPRSIKGVCLQHRRNNRQEMVWQFSCWGDDGRRKAMCSPLEDGVNAMVWESCYRAAAEAMWHMGTMHTGGGNHFVTEELARKRPPSWFDADKITLRHGRHVFLKL